MRGFVEAIVRVFKRQEVCRMLLVLAVMLPVFLLIALAGLWVGLPWAGPPVSFVVGLAVGVRAEPYVFGRVDRPWRKE